MKKNWFCAIVFSLILVLYTFAVSASNSPRNIFKFDKDEVPEIYFTNQSSPVYLYLSPSDPAHAEIVKALSETMAITLSKYNPDSGIDTGFFIVSKDGKKMINLRPGGVIEVDGEAYGTTVTQYNRLVQLGNDEYKGLKPIAQWCAYMTPQKIVKIEYSASPENKLSEIPAENIRIAAKELHQLEGKNGKLIFPGSLNLENWSNRTKVVYTFDNDVQYTVYANNSFLFIESKGMTYTCQYSGDYSGYIKRVRELASKPIGEASSPASLR